MNPFAAMALTFGIFSFSFALIAGIHWLAHKILIES